MKVGTLMACGYYVYLFSQVVYILPSYGLSLCYLTLFPVTHDLVGVPCQIPYLQLSVANACHLTNTIVVYVKVGTLMACGYYVYLFTQVVYILPSYGLSLCYLTLFPVTHDLVGVPCQIPYLQLSVANACHLTNTIVVYVKVGTLMACGYYVYLFTQVVYILPSYGLSLCYLTLFPVTHDLVGVPCQIPYLQLSVANACHLTNTIVVYVKVGTLMACGYVICMACGYYVYLFSQVVYILPSYGLSLCYLTLFPVTHDLVGVPCQIPYLQLSVANACHLTNTIVVYVKVGTLMACGYYVYLFTQVVYILPSYGLSLCYLTLFPVTHDLVGVPCQIPYLQLSVANACHLTNTIVVYVKVGTLMACGYYVYLFTQVVYILPSYGLSLCYLTLFPVTHDLVGVPCQIPYLQLSVANACHLTNTIVVYVKVGTLMACGYYVYLFTQVVYILPSYGLSLCYLTLFPVTQVLVGAPCQIPYLQLSVANACHLTNTIVVYVKVGTLMACGYYVFLFTQVVYILPSYGLSLCYLTLFPVSQVLVGAPCQIPYLQLSVANACHLTNTIVVYVKVGTLMACGYYVFLFTQVVYILPSYGLSLCYLTLFPVTHDLVGAQCQIPYLPVWII